MFQIKSTPLNPEQLKSRVRHSSAGGYVSFEGWVRNHNEGHRVKQLEYEAYESLAVKEARTIISEALEKFDITAAACEHRVGLLDIGDLAVWVGVSAPHRGDAFRACEYIINHIKTRLPIWKKEYYENGDSGWVNCEHCAAAHSHTGDESHIHSH